MSHNLCTVVQVAVIQAATQLQLQQLAESDALLVISLQTQLQAAAQELSSTRDPSTNIRDVTPHIPGATAATAGPNHRPATAASQATPTSVAAHPPTTADLTRIGPASGAGLAAVAASLRGAISPAAYTRAQSHSATVRQWLGPQKLVTVSERASHKTRGTMPCSNSDDYSSGSDGEDTQQDQHHNKPHTNLAKNQVTSSSNAGRNPSHRHFASQPQRTPALRHPHVHGNHEATSQQCALASPARGADAATDSPVIASNGVLNAEAQRLDLQQELEGWQRLAGLRQQHAELQQRHTDLQRQHMELGGTLSVLVKQQAVLERRNQGLEVEWGVEIGKAVTEVRGLSDEVGGDA